MSDTQEVETPTNNTAKDISIQGNTKGSYNEGDESIYYFMVLLAIILVVFSTIYFGVFSHVNPNGVVSNSGKLSSTINWITDPFETNRRINTTGRHDNKVYDKNDPRRECTEDEIEEIINTFVEEKGYFSDLSVENNMITFEINNSYFIKRCRPKPKTKYKWTIQDKLVGVIATTSVLDVTIQFLEAIADSKADDKTATKTDDKKTTKLEKIAEIKCKNKIKERGNLIDRIKIDDNKTRKIKGGTKITWKLYHNETLTCSYNATKGTATLL